MSVDSKEKGNFINSLDKIKMYHQTCKYTKQDPCGNISRVMYTKVYSAYAYEQGQQKMKIVSLGILTAIVVAKEKLAVVCPEGNE